MNDELQNTIALFRNETIAGLDRSARKIPAIGDLRVIRNPNFELRMLVDALETQSIFGKLVKQTKTTFRTGEIEIEGWWEHMVRNFFRRSSF